MALENVGIFAGKTLLMLGSNVGADDMVKYARDNGAYTIVADYYEASRSAAKRVADEAVMISTADIDALSKLVEERHVDGVLAGISEFNLLKAMTLAEKYHFPFYCTREQWDKVERKDHFRELCIENGVPCPVTFFKGEKSNLTREVYNKICYPAVIKPVDSCNSQGVHICFNEHELLKSVEAAFQFSASKNIIIEEYVSGTEFTAHYTICEGVPSFSCIDNRYPVSVHEGNVTTIPCARVFPSLFLDEYCKQVDRPMRTLCRALRIQNGVLFIQGMYNKNKGFCVFEAGLRSAGEAPYRFLRIVNGVDYSKLIVEHTLLGYSVSFDSSKETPNLHGKCCGIVSFIAKKGEVVGAINGLDEAISKVSSVVEYESRYPVGRTTPNGDTLRQIMIRFVMICDSREQMVNDVRYLNTHIEVLDRGGEEMVIKLEPERILDVY